MNQSRKRIALRIIVCLALIFGGISGMLIMDSMKKPPVEIKYKERPMEVETITAMPQDVRVFIRGFGDVRPLVVVPISSEVAGRIVEIHPRLEAGELIPKGEILFKIDPTNYKASYEDALARVSQKKSAIKRLIKEHETDTKRLKTLKRNKELALAEFKRLKKLYYNDKVGTKSGVERAEQSANAAADLFDQLKEKIDVYPIIMAETRAALESAKAFLVNAKAGLDRCCVRSPFNARIKDVNLELSQYVSPAMKLLTLADDSVLEIWVPIDSLEAKKWLGFGEFNGWFSHINHVVCKIRWTEDPHGNFFEGILHRVVKFDHNTRTLTVAVRVKKNNHTANVFPLVEGMFCSVEIPGKLIKNAIRLPRWSVSFENTVFMAKNGHLKTIPVKVAWTDGEDAIISHGIKKGDKVIVTRLVNPLENALLKIIETGKKG